MRLHSLAVRQCSIALKRFTAPCWNADEQHDRARDRSESGDPVGTDEDGKVLRECVVKVMEDAALRKRVGEAARAHAWREFSLEVFRHRVLALLGEAANKNGGPR